jgi:hypothetical protein
VAELSGGARTRILVKEGATFRFAQATFRVVAERGVTKWVNGGCIIFCLQLPDDPRLAISR